MRKHYKLILFDFDKTLYDGRHFALRLVLANLRHILRTKAERTVRHTLAGQDLDTGEYLRYELCRRLADRVGCTVSEAEDWYAHTYLPSMCRVLLSYKPRPMAVEVIGALLDAGVKVGVLSDYPETRERLMSIGIDDERILCLSSEDAGALKPAPRPFLEAARLVAVDPQEVLVVGDRADNDGGGAKAAGMDCLLIKGKKATGQDGFEALPWPEVAERLRTIAADALKAL